jgi:hypothetical protein
MIDNLTWGGHRGWMVECRYFLSIPPNKHSFWVLAEAFLEPW